MSIDAVVIEVIRNGFIAVTEEMKTNLMRTAYNTVIYEALDFTVGVFTPEGETVSIGLGLPSFIRGMSDTVKAKIAKLGLENIHPGDILITNDAYITGSHLNHITLTMPVFHGERLIAFTCCMAHWLDVGGSITNVTTDIYQEGLQIPILKYRSGGQVNQDLVDIISLNVRTPELAVGDLRAQATAVICGERRLLELAERYGADTLLSAIEAIMDQADLEARAVARTIADGVYEAESFMDDDAVNIGVRLPIRVRVVVSNGEVTIDLSEVSRQVPGFYNSGPSTGVSCAQMAYKCLTTPTFYPVNEGCFRSLKVIIAEGSIISAVRPASMRWWMTCPMTVVDTIFKALAPAMPTRVIAAHHADLCGVTFHGISAKTGRYFIGGIGPVGGGWGAKHNEDGMGVTVAINDGDTHNTPVEHLEARYPLMIESFNLRTDSGGAGRQRGGLGADLVIQALEPVHVSTGIERVHCRPWGLDGGMAAQGNSVQFRRDGAWNGDLPNGKLLNHRIARGDALMVRSGGGGGFGNPRERPRDIVEHDLAQGYISPESARDDYGLPL